jgi:hypothetical protein
MPALSKKRAQSPSQGLRTEEHKSETLQVRTVDFWYSHMIIIYV